MAQQVEPAGPVPENAPDHCPGTASEAAGRAEACEGCPNQADCQSAPKGPDPDLAAISHRLRNVKHKLLVLSGKGGVGKSTFSAQLAFALAAKGLQVGLLDIDICGPSIPKMLGLEGEEIHQSGAGWSPVFVEDNLGVMSIGFMLQGADDPVIWRGPRKNGLIKQFLRDVDWGELDYLVIDSPPGTSDEHISVVQYLKTSHVDGAVIVTTPQEVSIIDVRKEINFCKKVGMPVLGVVENMSGLQQSLSSFRFLLPGPDGAAQDVSEQVLQAVAAALPSSQTRFEARKRGLELGSPNKSIPRSGSMATRRPETWTSRRQQNGGQATPAAEAAPSDPLSTANGNGVPPGDPMSYYNSTRRPEGYSPYTEEEQTIVTQARTTHEQTTEHARRALQAAERTREIGAGTLDALHQQGKRLEMIDRDLQEIDTDVEESKSILAYMNRCCIFFLCASCCDCDGNKIRDETRKSRVKLRQNARRQELAQMAQEDQLRRAAQQNGAQPPMTEEETRDELMTGPSNARERLRKTRDHDSTNNGPQLGDGLAEADRTAIQKETATQDDYLDKIEDALGHLKQMGVEMNEELEQQDGHITRLQVQTEGTVQNLHQVTTGANKDWGLTKK